MRRGYEEVREQAERLDLAVARLQEALWDLGTEAKREGRKRTPDVAKVLAHVGAVKRAEEAVDIAHLDLETARGADA